MFQKTHSKHSSATTPITASTELLTTGISYLPTFQQAVLTIIMYRRIKKNELDYFRSMDIITSALIYLQSRSQLELKRVLQENRTSFMEICPEKNESMKENSAL